MNFALKVASLFLVVFFSFFWFSNISLAAPVEFSIRCNDETLSNCLGAIEKKYTLTIDRPEIFKKLNVTGQFKATDIPHLVVEMLNYSQIENYNMEIDREKNILKIGLAKNEAALTQANKAASDKSQQKQYKGELDLEKIIKQNANRKIPTDGEYPFPDGTSMSIKNFKNINEKLELYTPPKDARVPNEDKLITYDSIKQRADDTQKFYDQDYELVLPDGKKVNTKFLRSLRK